MFFITTDFDASVEGLFPRIFNFVHPRETEANIRIVKEDGLSAVFHNCQEVELEAHRVFISGNAFPHQAGTLESALEKAIQMGNGEGLVHGNFNLIVFYIGDRYFLHSDSCQLHDPFDRGLTFSIWIKQLSPKK